MRGSTSQEVKQEMANKKNEPTGGEEPGLLKLKIDPTCTICAETKEQIRRAGGRVPDGTMLVTTPNRTCSGIVVGQHVDLVKTTREAADALRMCKTK